MKQKILNSERDKAELIVPAVCLLEALDIAEKKRIEFDINGFFNFVEDHFIISPLKLELISVIRTVGNDLELHDRTVVATAKLYEAKVLSKDSQIRELKATETIW